ncbi:MAG: glycosyltransferase family 4 protein [Bacteroidales bacterium]|nr:glycosyltransferase family 4 protein [Bacteroidales bacterium]
MNIAFDAKRAFLNRSGLGNYSRLVIQSMMKYHGENNYFLFTPSVHPKIFNPTDFVYAEVRTPYKLHQRYFNAAWRSFGIAGELGKDKISVYHGLSGEIPHKIHNYGIKSVVTIHDLIFLHYPDLYKRIDRKIYEKKFRYACTNTDRIIAISEQTKTDIVNFFGIDKQNITILYQGCQEIFQHEVPLGQKQSVKSKYGLPDNYVLYVGTVEKRKNLMSVVKAIHEGKIDTTLVVIGRQTKYSALVSEYIVKHKLKNIRFLEGVSNSELPSIYQAATVFVYPSLFEGFGIPIIEALYSGVPVVTSKGGCFAEAGGPGSCYVDTSSPEAIADAIKQLLSDEELRRKMIDAGLKYVHKFDHETLAGQLNSIYQSL